MSLSQKTVIQSSATPDADLELTISDTPDPLSVNNQIDFTLTVTNVDSPDPDDDVAIAVELTGVFTGVTHTVDSVTSSQGTVQCTGPELSDCVIQLGDLDVGANATVQVLAHTYGRGHTYAHVNCSKHRGQCGP